MMGGTAFENDLYDDSHGGNTFDRIPLFFGFGYNGIMER